MRVRLTRKLADYIDGVDLSAHEVGDIFELPVSEAHLLIAEDWAEAHIAELRVGDFGRSNVEIALAGPIPDAEAADDPTRGLRTLEQIRRIRRQLERRWSEQTEHRRLEDGVREELRDSRARTVRKDPRLSNGKR